jgi:hypothetical protein
MFRLSFLYLVVAIIAIFSPTLVSARWSLTPRLYVEEQYDDNIFLTEINEQDDFITTISPGVNLEYQTPTEIIDLDYEFRRSYYKDFSELDFSGHRGRAEARKDFGPRFGAGIREVFIRSEDPIELTGVPTFERPSIRTGRRNKYTRNIVEPEVTLNFYENRSIRVGYRNHILRNKAEDIADFDENAINALLIFRFDIHNGIEVDYEHIDLDYDPTDPPQATRDFDGDLIRGRYTHYFNPRTSAFFEHRYYQKDLDEESPGFVDYNVHDPRVGISYDLYENTSLTASAGYAFRNVDKADDEETFSAELNVSSQYKRLGAEVYGETGFQDDFRSAEVLGFNEFWRVGFDGSYQLLRRLWAEAFLYVERDRFVDLERKDTISHIRGRLRYQPLRWLFLSLEYRYNERDSNIPFESFRDNRYFGRITVQHDVAEQFQ